MSVNEYPRIRYVVDPDELTPVQKFGDYLLKRDDLFTVAGCYGGKARTAWKLAQNSVGLVTAGHLDSPQINIVAHIGKKLGVPVHCHTSTGKLSAELLDAQEAGAKIFQHRPGYGTVLRKRAKDDAEENMWTLIPFGMESNDVVREIAKQMCNIPFGKFKRLVTIVGSGMTLCGILRGLQVLGKETTPVLGVLVGADPSKRLMEYVPDVNFKNLTVERSPLNYKQRFKYPFLVQDKEKLRLDSIYEAKYIPYLKKGDMVWVVGIHRLERVENI